MFPIRSLGDRIESSATAHAPVQKLHIQGDITP
jgi:hypothetical protein